MQKGKIGVTTENIFPVIKKFLYSDNDIFLREMVSNAVDATQKLKVLATAGDYKSEIVDPTVRISVDKKNKTITISDHGIGMTKEEIDKYINQIAFSSAEEFIEKYKDDVNAIIGHFGLGFYSAFMVSNKVEIKTKSYTKDAKAVRWECDGSPEFFIEEIEKDTVGTDIILHIDDESKEFLEENRINELLNKYCKFLPVEIVFGKKKDYKDGKEVETEEDNIINDTKPAWTKKPADLKEEDYNKFYHQLYPYIVEDPLFNIHLNVDYPFNLTGILYFPHIKDNLDIQKNKIQLYSNQVFVTDSVEDIVPDFLTLLHGVIDSPDIPLNVSRSFLQNDSNVKKISSHISKKVADKLNEIFKKDRAEFEKKWSDLRLFIEYGILSNEKFYERAKDFTLFTNTDKKCFTFDEYKNIIKENQTDKDGKLIYLYSTNAEEQFSFIESAKAKGYDVLLMDGQLDVHFINFLEQKFEKSQFVRVDSDIVDKLIQKDKTNESKLTVEQQNRLRPVFKSRLKNKEVFSVIFENMEENEAPVLITQSEFMRRMKDMSSLNQMNFYGNLPDNYNLVINTNHRLIVKISEDVDKKNEAKLKKFDDELSPIIEEKKALDEKNKDKKEEEIEQVEKDKTKELQEKIDEINKKKDEVLSSYGLKNKIVKQLIDLALISNNMLKGEDLNLFVKRSIDLIK
ncbi:MAG: molecular chaperone HtpG [Bacteroidetes bacterium]|nr:MAG: molecular chaperone HtpG [Bacteroidota bacterium]